MLVLDSIQLENWYPVKEVAAVLCFSEDTIIRQINRGYLKAFVLPWRTNTRRRFYVSRRVQGSEIVPYVKCYMTRS